MRAFFVGLPIKLIFLMFVPLYLFGYEEPAKILHLTFHRGCEREITAIAKALSLDLETWYIPDLPPKFLDGSTTGNALYNMGHGRAENIWKRHGDYFNSFDAVIVSDTAPLSRIFLQNGWDKPLIIWICNRFDYCDSASLDCDFPDAEYYRLFQEALFKPWVKIIGYTEFEHAYARSRGVETGGLTIKPCGASQSLPITQALIPSWVDKPDTFYLPPYWNESQFMDLAGFCTRLGIACYNGRYSSPFELIDFKGIIHLPYSWSNLAFFENIALGIPYFVPSPSFFRQLAGQGNYFHPSLSSLLDEDLFYLSEWYCPEHAQFIVYFESWEDLQEKIAVIDFINLRKKLKTHARLHRSIMIDRWKTVFEEIFRNKRL